MIWNDIYRTTFEETLQLIINAESWNISPTLGKQGFLMIMGNSADSIVFLSFRKLALEVKAFSCTVESAAKIFRITVNQARLIIATLPIRLINAFKYVFGFLDARVSSIGKRSIILLER